jgi:hypothetical protein
MYSYLAFPTHIVVHHRCLQGTTGKMTQKTKRKLWTFGGGAQWDNPDAHAYRSKKIFRSTHY